MYNILGLPVTYVHIFVISLLPDKADIVRDEVVETDCDKFRLLPLYLMNITFKSVHFVNNLNLL